MSLLMEALKKAEHSKEPAPSHQDSNPLSLSEVDFPAIDEESLQPEEFIPEPVSSIVPPPPKKTAETPSQEMAKTIFAAKQPIMSNRILLIIGGSLIFSMLGVIAGLYYWQKATQFVELAVPSPTQHVAQKTVTEPIAEKNDDDTATKIITDKSKPVQREEGRTEEEKDRRQAATDQIRIQKATVAPAVNSDLMSAYQLFSSGDAKSAKPLYENVLRIDPNNRDALLGMAAVALSENQSDRAGAIYSRLLEMNPSDPNAIAGLASIKRGNPENSETQLKKVLAQSPESAPNLFELGNVYMQQSRWAEAQEMYFRAFGASPDSADYAFNLAVSLDRLGQNKLALDYYQRAVALKVKDAASRFNREAATNRIEQLRN